MPDPGVLEEVLLVRVMTASCQRSPANARIDSTSSQTVTYTNSVEDGSRGLPTCWATSPACCDTSGTAVSRRNASNSRSLPGWIVGLIWGHEVQHHTYLRVVPTADLNTTFAMALAVFFLPGILFGAVWSIFHILIILLQAYIFMMLTVVYLAMAHEHH